MQTAFSPIIGLENSYALSPSAEKIMGGKLNNNDPPILDL